MKAKKKALTEVWFVVCKQNSTQQKFSASFIDKTLKCEQRFVNSAATFFLFFTSTSFIFAFDFQVFTFFFRGDKSFSFYRKRKTAELVECATRNRRLCEFVSSDKKQAREAFWSGKKIEVWTSDSSKSGCTLPKNKRKNQQKSKKFNSRAGKKEANETSESNKKRTRLDNNQPERLFFYGNQTRPGRGREKKQQFDIQHTISERKSHSHDGYH